MAIKPQPYDINNAVLNLGFNINGNPFDKKLGSKASVDLEFDGDQMLKALSMSYYGNMLGVHLSLESIMFHAIELVI